MCMIIAQECKKWVRVQHATIGVKDALEKLLSTKGASESHEAVAGCDSGLLSAYLDS